MPRALIHLVLAVALAVPHCAAWTAADGTPTPVDGKVRTHGAARLPALALVAAGRLKDAAPDARLWADLVGPARVPVMAVTRVPVTALAPVCIGCTGQRTLAARAPPPA